MQCGQHGQLGRTRVLWGLLTLRKERNPKDLLVPNLQMATVRPVIMLPGKWQDWAQKLGPANLRWITFYI